MSRLCQSLETYLKWALALLLALMVIDVTWQVITRFLLTQPSSFTEELARYLLIWIGLLGASYAYRTHSHLGIDILVRKFKGTSRAGAITMAIVCNIIFAALVMVQGGFNLMRLTFELEQTSAALAIPMAWVYSVIPLSGLLIILFSLDHLLKLRRGEYTQADASL